ncbi:MAG: voltage-gated chloride channel family protein [Sumerlaeia bacterium]
MKQDFPATIRFILLWSMLVIPLSIATGSVVALFLWLLEWATISRFAAPWVLVFLPVAGIAIVWVYKEYGGESAKGNNLIIEHIHEPAAGRIPLRMAPLVLLATVVTHLFGGSAGREGTAVQIGGSIAGRITEVFRFSAETRRMYLMCGVAAGFGAVFGTPIAGAIFAIEVITVGRIRYQALFPCLVASLLADQACIFWNIEHTHYSIRSLYEISESSTTHTIKLSWVFLAGACGIGFGLVARLFAISLRFFENQFNHQITTWWLRPVVGALLVLGISLLLGTTDYLGLGVRSATAEGVSILSSFEGNVGVLSWFWKLLLTAITLSCGFKGGEVTPLFFIGATLGAAFANLLGMPPDVFAAIGFVAVFAGATNTPIACTIMGVELFGGESIVYMAVGCFVAFLVSGRKGIYHSQLSGDKKIESEKTSSLKT